MLLNLSVGVAGSRGSFWLLNESPVRCGLQKLLMIVDDYVDAIETRRCS